MAPHLRAEYRMKGESLIHGQCCQASNNLRKDDRIVTVRSLASKSLIDYWISFDVTFLMSRAVCAANLMQLGDQRPDFA